MLHLKRVSLSLSNKNEWESNDSQPNDTKLCIILHTLLMGLKHQMQAK